MFFFFVFLGKNESCIGESGESRVWLVCLDCEVILLFFLVVIFWLRSSLKSDKLVLKFYLRFVGYFFLL